MSEPQLLREAAGGPAWSEAAPVADRTQWLARSVLPHEPALRAWLRRRSVAGLEIDDVIQETYVQLVRLPCVAHIVAPRAYAFRVARSIVRRHLQRARIVPMAAMDDIDLDATPLDAPSPEQHTDARLQLDRLADVVAQLPAKCRQAFLLRRLEGLSQRDVARRMGISESTVEKHMTRALQFLMRALRQGDLAEASDPTTSTRGPGVDR